MTHDQEVVGSNPGTLYWMDLSVASYYIKEKLKIKVAKWGTPKKYFKKPTSNLIISTSLTKPIIRFKGLKS
jgi:hypothetical protein